MHAQLSMDCSPPGFSVHGISLLQEIFLTQGSNLSLLHCRQILYHLSPGKPRFLIPLSHTTSLVMFMPQDLCTCCSFYLERSFQGSLITTPLPSSGLGSSILELSGFSHGRRTTVSVVRQEICFRNRILHSCGISSGSESLEGWIWRVRQSLTSSPAALVQDRAWGESEKPGTFSP